MNINIIATIGKENEIGKNNKLLWNLPENELFFRELTKNGSVVMGRRMYSLLPELLQNRKYIVLSRSNELPPEIEVYNSIKSFINNNFDSDENFFVIGGGATFRKFIDLAETLYLTEVDSVYSKADTYFPAIYYHEFEREILAECEENTISYKRVLYRRK